MKIVITGLLVLLCLQAKTQFQGAVYKQAIDAVVAAGSGNMNSAWAGGFNSIQINHVDLNQDGRNDLILYDNNNRNAVRTFINIGNAGEVKYSYQPQYEINFNMVTDYLLIRDYNCDGIPDLFCRGNPGITVYKGYYQNAQLKFNLYKSLWYQTATGWVNAYVQPTDIPSIVDIDGDGDLDFFGYEVNGFYLSWYKNMRVEDGLPCDSIRIVLADKCWGKFYQGVERSVITNITCKGGSAPLNKTRHPKNTVLHLDIDNDGDLDMLNGNVSYSDIQLYFNNGSNVVFDQDTLYNKNGHQLKMPNWPASTLVDIDNDGDKDLLFTGHDDNLNIANYKTINWYKNIGSASAPVYNYVSDTLLMKDLIDVGTNSYPVLFDYDKDGKKDLFIGSEGYYNNESDTMLCKMAYYKNTTTGNTISFQFITDDFLNLSQKNIKGIFPAFGDITGDDIDDLVLGTVKGNLLLYKNMASSNTVQPQFQWQTDSIAVPIPGKYATPCVYDFNNDGKNDLICGNQIGTLVYYRDSSTTTSTVLKWVTSNLGGLKAGLVSHLYGYSVPFIGRMDNISRDFLLVGNVDGYVERYDSFKNNLGNFKRIDSNYSFIQVPYRSSPTAADLDGDGMYELFTGNKLGGLLYYKQQILASHQTIQDKKLNVVVYPNPCSDKIHLLSSSDLSNATFSLYDVLGKKIASLYLDSNYNTLKLPLLTPGFYLLGISLNEQTTLQKVLVE